MNELKVKCGVTGLMSAKSVSKVSSVITLNHYLRYSSVSLMLMLLGPSIRTLAKELGDT